MAIDRSVPNETVFESVSRCVRNRHLANRQRCDVSTLEQTMNGVSVSLELRLAA
jgi:hypothetical protein